MKSISSIAVFLAIAHSLSASPINKRQAPVSSLLSSAVPSLPVPSAASSVASSVAVPIVGDSSAAAPTPSAPIATPSAASASASASATPTSYDFSCPSPYLLTYVEKQATVQESLANVLAALGNFTDAPYVGQVSSNGEGNTVGATRNVSFGGQIAEETLTNFTTNATSQAIIEMYTSPGNLTFATLNIANYSAEFAVYPNDSAPDTTTTLKYFVNFCASSQLLGAQALGGYADAVFANITTLLSNSTSTPVASSAAASSATPVVPVAGSTSEAPSASVGSASGSLTPSAAFSAATSTATGGVLTINTPPSLVECEPIAITYSGGTAPYFLSVLPGGQTSAVALEQFPQQSSAGSFTWTVNIASGTAITLAIRDGTGAINYSSQITIQAGTSSSCITPA